MKIFIINLERSKDRKKFMEEQYKKFRIPYEFFKATDGKNISDEWIENNLSKEFKKEYEKYKNRFIKKGAIGCADSHRRLWKYILNKYNEDEIFLILEDDSYLIENEDFLNKCEKIFKSSPYDFMLMYYSSLKPLKLNKKNRIKINNNYYIYEHPGQPVSISCAYMLTYNGAKKLLSSQEQYITRMADAWDFDDVGIKASLIYPLPFVTNMFSSTIVSSNYKQNIKKILVYSFMKVPFFKSLIRNFLSKRVTNVKIEG